MDSTGLGHAMRRPLLVLCSAVVLAEDVWPEGTARDPGCALDCDGMARRHGPERSYPLVQLLRGNAQDARKSRLTAFHPLNRRLNWSHAASKAQLFFDCKALVYWLSRLKLGSSINA